MHRIAAFVVIGATILLRSVSSHSNLGNQILKRALTRLCVRYHALAFPKQRCVQASFIAIATISLGINFVAQQPSRAAADATLNPINQRYETSGLLQTGALSSRLGNEPREIRDTQNVNLAQVFVSPTIPAGIPTVWYVTPASFPAHQGMMSHSTSGGMSVNWYAAPVLPQNPPATLPYPSSGRGSPTWYTPSAVYRGSQEQVFYPNPGGIPFSSYAAPMVPASLPQPYPRRPSPVVQTPNYVPQLNLPPVELQTPLPVTHTPPSSRTAISRNGGFRTIAYRPNQTYVITLDSNTTPETYEWDPSVTFNPNGHVHLSNPQQAGSVRVRIFADEEQVAEVILDGLDMQTLELSQYIGRNMKVQMEYGLDNP